MRYLLLLSLALAAGCNESPPPPLPAPRDFSGDVTKLQHEVADMKVQLAAVQKQLKGHREVFTYIEANLWRIDDELHSDNTPVRFAHESTVDGLLEFLRRIDDGSFKGK